MVGGYPEVTSKDDDGARQISRYLRGRAGGIARGAGNCEFKSRRPDHALRLLLCSVSENCLDCAAVMLTDA
jgi:hypothetical protein